MNHEVIDHLDSVIQDALEEAFGREGQAYNGTFLGMWSTKLAECFKSGEAIDPDFDGSIDTDYF